MLNNSLSVIKTTTSAAVIDPDRIVLGSDDGLFCIDLDRKGNFNFFKGPNILIVFLLTL